MDLARFDYFRNRVLSLTHRENMEWAGYPSSKISQETFSSVLSVLKRDPVAPVRIVPRVRSLVWGPGPAYPFPQALNFMGPDLQSFEFECTTAHDGERMQKLESGIATLDGVQSQLRTIRFVWGFEYEYETLEKCFARFLGSQTHLETLHSLVPLARNSVASLKNSRETLTVLDCKLVEGQETPISLLFETGFLALQLISVHKRDGSIDFAAISPLLACRTIRRFRVACEKINILLPSQVSAMGEAWPLIEDFRLSAARWFNQPFSLLSAFANHMGSTLQVIEMDFNVEATTVLPAVTEEETFKVLKEVSVGDLGSLVCGREEEVARYITALCPPGIKLSPPLHWENFDFETASAERDGWWKAGDILDKLREVECDAQ